MKLMFLIAAGLLIFLMPCASALPQASQPEAQPSIQAIRTDRPPDTAEIRRAKLFGQLLGTKMSLTCQDMPIRDALAMFRKASGIRVIGRFSDDPVGFGIEAGQRVSIAADDAIALDVLEEILKQCSAVHECTWQLRRGFVEVSTKERLSVPAAREMRLYDVRDIAFNARVLAPPEEGLPPPANAVYVVEQICENIEPTRWDYGQQIEPAEEERLPSAPAPLDQDGGGPTIDQLLEQNSRDPAEAPPPPTARRAQLGVPIWATIRTFRENLIVIAPDFIHRQIGGYPEPILPGSGDTQRTTPGAREADTSQIDWREVP